MSWADDIRCLYCDGRLPLYRKITNGQFCSGAHRKAYWQEHERLAVERLHQTHDTLRAYRPAGAIEKILGPGALGEDQPTVEMPVYVPPDAVDSRPQWSPQAHIYTEVEEPRSLAKLIPPPIFRLPRFLPDHVASIDAYPIEASSTMQWPVLVWRVGDYTLVSAPVVPVPMTDARNTPMAVYEVAAINPNIDGAHPSIDLRLEAVKVAAPWADIQQVLDEETPEFADVLALPSVPVRESIATAMAQISPAAIGLRAHLPLNILRMGASLLRAALLQAGLRQLPISNVAVAQKPVSQDDLGAIDLRATAEAPQLMMVSAAQLALRMPRLTLAAGSRYRVETQQAAPVTLVPESETYATMPPQISLPERNVKVMVAAASRTSSANVLATQDSVKSQELAAPHVEPAFQPETMGMLPLACTARPSQPAIEMRPAPASMSLPQPLEPRPLRPDSKLEPIDAKPIADSIPASEPLQPADGKPPVASDGHMHVWAHAIDFWNRAPRDLKMLVFAIPVLLGLALHPSLPKVRVAAPAAANGIERNMQKAFSSKWVNVRQTMMDRAAVALDEDFRQGLDEWVSRGNATAEWSFDSNGFVRPGPLALYRPTMGLSDYQMQFLGVLDKQALSWVVRATDYDNFYVIKLMTLKTGPLPTIGVVRYAVVDGKADSRVDTIAPLDARSDTLYRVRVDVRGDDFALSVQGQMVDSWTEPRLKRGGIGFFSARGEESRLRWVQVTHQYDMLGRLCAYLAPYNIPSTTGSWQQ